MQEYLRSSTAGGGLLAGGVIAALLWANSPWDQTYEHVWRTGAAIGIGRWQIDADLRFWASEGLLTLFFLLAGLEMKREIVTGELRRWHAAVLPLVGALGGMVVPAVLFLAITWGSPAADAWGAALPTDLAFALGILVLAARAAPRGLRPFLLTLAIVDDLATVLIVAVFYSADVSWMPVVVALLATLGVILAAALSIRSVAPYLLLGALAWYSLYVGGVHPAIAGAVFGLLTPAVAFQRPAHVSEAAHRIADETVDEPDPPDVDAPRWLELAWLSREAVSPLARVEHSLLPWVNLAVLPAFAVANAGVSLAGDGLTGSAERRLAVGLLAARLVGKVVGIAGACALMIRLGLGKLPRGVSMRALVGVAAAAGAPFTVSLFVVGTTFPEGSTLLSSARTAVLVSMVVCGAVALLVLRGDDRRT